jgi:hypothetical protein
MVIFHNYVNLPEGSSNCSFDFLKHKALVRAQILIEMHHEVISYPNKHWQITSDVDSCLMKKHVGAWMPQFHFMSIFLHSLPEKCSCARHGMKFMLSAKQIII